MRTRWQLAGLVCTILAACGGGGQSGDSKEPTSPLVVGDDAGSGQNECTDADGDEHGDGCEAGPDCDDQNPKLYEKCGTCPAGQEGCACDEGAAPVECQVVIKATEDTTLCKVGKSYCRDGEWSKCEGISLIETKH